MVNDARTAAGGDDGADYLAAVEALCSLGERTERELAGAADYGRGELREAASRRRSREQEWERLERRAAQAERTARSLAHAHDVGVDADAPVPDAPAGAADTGRELSRVEADLPVFVGNGVCRILYYLYPFDKGIFEYRSNNLQIRALRYIECNITLLSDVNHCRVYSGIHLKVLGVTANRHRK